MIIHKDAVSFLHSPCETRGDKLFASRDQIMFVTKGFCRGIDAKKAVKGRGEVIQRTLSHPGRRHSGDPKFSRPALRRDGNTQQDFGWKGCTAKHGASYFWVTAKPTESACK